LGWIETERGAFVVSVPFPIDVNFASGICLSITVPFSIALTLANSVCLAAVGYADTVPDRIAIPFRLPALSAKGIAFPVGRLFKPGYSLNACVAVAYRNAPA
jgi:hypothetical protein